MIPVLVLTSISFPSILFGLRSWWEIVVIVVLLCLWGIFVTFREKLRKYRTRSWPTCHGIVANLTMRKVDGGANGIDYWKITFDYNYKVEKELSGSYAFNCTSEKIADGAVAGLTGKTVTVHYKPADASKALLWEDEVWDIWWDTYWSSDKNG